MSINQPLKAVAYDLPRWHAYFAEQALQRVAIRFGFALVLAFGSLAWWVA